MTDATPDAPEVSAAVQSLRDRNQLVTQSVGKLQHVIGDGVLAIADAFEEVTPTTVGDELRLDVSMHAIGYILTGVAVLQLLTLHGTTDEMREYEPAIQRAAKDLEGAMQNLRNRSTNEWTSLLPTERMIKFYERPEHSTPLPPAQPTVLLGAQDEKGNIKPFTDLIS